MKFDFRHTILPFNGMHYGVFLALNIVIACRVFSNYSYRCFAHYHRLTLLKMHKHFQFFHCMPHVYLAHDEWSWRKNYTMNGTEQKTLLFYLIEWSGWRFHWNLSAFSAFFPNCQYLTCRHQSNGPFNRIEQIKWMTSCFFFHVTKHI